MTSRTEMAPPAEQPCRDCPWRTANHGKRHPDGWYRKDNRRRLWAGLKDGEHMTCHPTDPDNPVPDGWRTVPVGTRTRVCAGAHQLILQALDATGRDDVDYPTDRATMTRRGIGRHVERLIFNPALYPRKITLADVAVAVRKETP